MHATLQNNNLFSDHIISSRSAKLAGLLLAKSCKHFEYFYAEFLHAGKVQGSDILFVTSSEQRVFLLHTKKKQF